MAWKIDTQPATEPVTLTEVKADLKMDDISDDDTTLTELIVVARQAAEQYTQRMFIDTVVNEYFKSWGDCLELSLSPVSAINEIYYVDADGVSTELTSANYQADLISEPSKIYPKVNGSFPTLQSGAINPIRVKYTVGYGSAASDVPSPIKKSIRLMVGDLYTNPQDRMNKEKMLSQTQLHMYRMKKY